MTSVAPQDLQAQDAAHRTPPTPAYWVAVCTPEETASEDDLVAMLPTHLQWVRTIDERNQLFLAGPLLSGPHVRPGAGIMIFRVEDETEALALANQDPFKTAGLRAFVLCHWQPHAGSLSLRLSLRDHGYDWH